MLGLSQISTIRPPICCWWAPRRGRGSRFRQTFCIRRAGYRYDGAVDQPGALTGFVAGQTGDRGTAAGTAADPDHGRVSALGTGAGWAASSRIWTRLRRRSRRRAPPQRCHQQPGLLYPAGDSPVVPRDGPSGRDLAGEAVPDQQLAHALDGVALVETVANPGPGQGPSLIRPARCERPLRQLCLQLGKWALLSRAGEAELVENKARSSPLTQDFRHRCTDRTLTRRSFASTELSSLRPNRSAAS